MSSRLQVDASINAQYVYTWTPRRPRVGKYPAILLPGAMTNPAAGPMWAGNVAWPSAMKLAGLLARGSAASGGYGIPTLSAYFAGNTYANDTAMGLIDQALTTVAAKTGSSAVKAHLIGASMGSGAAIRYAALNPTKVASLNLFIPMVSLLSLYYGNPNALGFVAGGFTYDIATAWARTLSTVTDAAVTNGSPTITSPGGQFTAAMDGRAVVSNTSFLQTPNGKFPDGTTAAYVNATTMTASVPCTGTTAGGLTIALAQLLPTTGSPNADLLALAPAIAAAGIPTWLWYSTVDPFIKVSDVTAMAAAAGALAVPVDSAAGHANGTIANVDTYNNGADFSYLISRLITNGA